MVGLDIFEIILAISLFVALILARKFKPNEAELRRQLFEVCDLGANARPVEEIDYTLSVKVTLTPLRFLELNELDERLSMIAKLTLYWQHPCVADVWAVNATKWIGLEEGIVESAQNVWLVPLMHVTSVSDVLLSKSSAGDSTIVIRNDGRIRWNLIKRFDTRCGMYLRTMPFDEQQCEMRFEFLMDQRLLDSNATTITFAESEVISNGSLWEYVDSYSEVHYKTYSTSPEKSYAQPTFHIRLRRKSMFYITCVFVPCLALVFLQIGFIALPPNDSNRPYYCVTVLLSYMFLESMVRSSMPKTSETALILVFLAAQLVLSVICTLYALISCMLAHSHRDKFLGREQVYYCCRFRRFKLSLTLLRFCDLLTFIGIICFVVFVSLFIFLQMSL